MSHLTFLFLQVVHDLGLIPEPGTAPLLRVVGDFVVVDGSGDELDF